MQELLNNKFIPNKLYKFGNKIVKIKKVQKTKKIIIACDVESGDSILFPTDGADLVLHRLYTIGEISKIVERRPDTIRKYEKRGLLPKPEQIDGSGSYKNWRLYTASHVYEMVEFFNGRVSGRPSSSGGKLDTRIKALNQKVKLVNKNFSA
jgi:hypothetical protein